MNTRYYESSPQIIGTVNGGMSKCFEVQIPSKAKLARLAIIQTDGVLEHFTAEFYNKREACLGESIADSDSPGVGTLPSVLFRFTPVFSSQVPGEYIDFFDNKNYYFYSHDEDSSTGPGRTAYLKITPQGTGPKEFSLVVGVLLASAP